MMKNLFIASDGTVIDDGSESSCDCYVRKNGEGFYSIITVHGRRIFAAVTDEQWRTIKADAESRGAIFAGITTNG